MQCGRTRQSKGFLVGGGARGLVSPLASVVRPAGGESSQYHSIFHLIRGHMNIGVYRCGDFP